MEPISAKNKIFITDIWDASKIRNLPADIQDQIK